MSIEKNIENVIKNSNMTIKEIAEKLGCSTKQITRWKNGEQEMGIYKLKALCKLLEISADDILELQN